MLTNDFNWQMYDTPFRSYDPQLGRFHQIDLLADKAPGINPYRFGFNNPININDPTGLWEGSLRDMINEAWNRAPDGVTIFHVRGNDLIRDLNAENNLDHFINDFLSYGGTAEFMQDSGGGFWIDYNKPLLITGNIASQGDNTYKANIHAIQSKFVKTASLNLNANYGQLAFGIGLAGTGELLDAGGKFFYDSKTQTWGGKNLKQYSMSWGGNQHTGGKFKFARTTSRILKTANGALTFYSYYDNQMKYENGEISEMTRNIEQGSNTFGVFLPGWSLGWEIGRGITEIPGYKKWKFNTFLPWRMKTFGY